MECCSGEGIVSDRLSVMLVEDEYLIAQMVHGALQQGGFDVTLHGNGAEAWRVLNSSMPPPVLVTDINAGDGPNGWEIARYARNRRPDLAVVYMTGAAADEWPIHGVPGSILVPKPFSQIEIVTAVCKLVYRGNWFGRLPVRKQRPHMQ